MPCPAAYSRFWASITERKEEEGVILSSQGGDQSEFGCEEMEGGWPKKDKRCSNDDV